MRILIVDDNPLIVDDLTAELEIIDQSSVCFKAYSGREALEVVEKENLDVIFCDIEMNDIDGITLAKMIKDKQSACNFIFVTGHQEYALAAHKVYSSGFLVKPVSTDDLRNSLENLRFPIESFTLKRGIYVRCFGNFDVFYDDKPLIFKRSKSKELFAYMVDRKGGACTMGELMGILFEDRENTNSQKSYMRSIISDLKNTFKEVGRDDILIKGWNTLAVDTEKFHCDYYDYLAGKPDAINRYRGEYMYQYSWAEMSIKHRL